MTCEHCRFLEDSTSHYHRDVPWQSTRFRIHFFEYERFVVWGLTARLLIQVAEKAFNRLPAFEDIESGGRPYGDIVYDGTVVRYKDQ